MAFRAKQAVYDASKLLLSSRARGDTKLGVVAIRRRIAPQLRPLPDFLVIGAMRAGTTSLFKYLDSHPATAASLRKEVHYFSRRYDSRDLDWYRSHFPLTRRRLAFEATPGYLCHPDAPKRAADVIPGVRLVVLLREPVARARSQHAHWVAHGRESRTFEAAIDDEAARGLNLGFPAWDDYLSKSLYGLHLQRWLMHHPPERIGVFESERLFADTAGALAGIARFLDIDPAGFTSIAHNYSHRHDGGVPASRAASVASLPAVTRDALTKDAALLGEILADLPFATVPRWIATPWS